MIGDAIPSEISLGLFYVIVNLILFGEFLIVGCETNLSKLFLSDLNVARDLIFFSKFNWISYIFFLLYDILEAFSVSDRQNTITLIISSE